MVQGSKPLNCVLFPEYHQIKGLLPELVKNPIFGNFPCLKSNIPLTEKRIKAIKRLHKMSRREEALSNANLFGVPFFIFDIKPLTKQLKRDNPKKQSLSVVDYDRLLCEKLEPTGFLDNIMDVLSELDAPGGMVHLFEKLEDKALIKGLLEKMDRPKVVHRLKKGRIQRLKRNLDRPAYAPI